MLPDIFILVNKDFQKSSNYLAIRCIRFRH